MHKDQCMQILNLLSPDPPTILNELPKSIAKEISDLSSSKNIFHDAVPLYKEALQKSGFTFELVYTPKQFDHNNNNAGLFRRGMRSHVHMPTHMQKCLYV